MSIRLVDLIRKVRACKSAAEERAVIKKESADVRSALKEQSMAVFRQRNIAKLMFIDMLGYPTHFAQMEVINLIASPDFGQKRVGYLALSVLLNESTEVLLLVTQAMQSDLHSNVPYIAGLALSALGCIASADMARDLSADVIEILRSGHPYLCKKAALCAVRMVRRLPDLSEEFLSPALALLEERTHGPLLGGVTLCQAMLQETKGSLKKRIKKRLRQKALVPMCNKLRSLATSSDREYDAAGVCDPFLQCKIISMLSLLAQGNAASEQKVVDTLAFVSNALEGDTQAANAVLYEAVRTMLSLDASGRDKALQTLAVNILGRFLQARDHNMKYIALATLAAASHGNHTALQRHHSTVVACLKDADATIRRRALSLLFALVTKARVRDLTQELLAFLTLAQSSDDVEFRRELAHKICAIVARYAPTRQWHVDTMIQVMLRAEELVPEGRARELALLVADADEETRAFAVHAAWAALQRQSQLETPLTRFALWLCGHEFALLSSARGVQMARQHHCADAREVTVESALSQIEKVLADRSVSEETRAHCVSALLKLSQHAADPSALKAVIERESHSVSLEVQTRAVEYLALVSAIDAETREAVLAPVPALDWDEVKQRHTEQTGEVLADEDEDYSDDEDQAGYSDDQAGYSDDEVPQASSTRGYEEEEEQPKSSPPPDTSMEDLLGLGVSSPAPTTPPPVSGGGDLFGILSPTMPPTTTTEPLDPLADLLGAASPSTPTVPQDTGTTLMDQEGMRVTLQFASKSTASAALVAATIRNTGTQEVSAVSLEVRAPRYLQLQMKPPSATSLAPAAAAEQRLRILRADTSKPFAIIARLTWRSADGQEHRWQSEQFRDFPHFD